MAAAGAEMADVNQEGVPGSAVPSGLGGLFGRKPSDESRGYYRSSRWDGECASREQMN